MEKLTCILATESNKIKVCLPNYNKGTLVLDAKIKFYFDTIESETTTVSYKAFKDSTEIGGWDNVNIYTTENNNTLHTLNITDEVRDCISKEGTSLELTFSGIANVNVEKDESQAKADFEYITINDYNLNASKQSFNVGMVGSGELNLSTGKFILNQNLINDELSLPFNVGMVYNSEIENCLDNRYAHLTKTYTENGFKFSFLHYLIKEQSEEGELRFTYIDSYAEKHQFKEKYYYKDEQNTKHYINRNEVNVDLDGTLYYNGNKKHVVETELETDTGLKLVSSITGLNGSDLVDYEPEELANVKQSLKSLKENQKTYINKFEELKYQYVLFKLEKLNNENNTETVNLNSNINYNSDVKEILQTNLDEKELAYKPEDIFSLEETNNIVNNLISQSKVYKQNKYENNGVGDILTKTFTSEYTLDNQIKNIIKSICDCYEALQTLKEQISKYEYQKNLLEMQVPVHYLYNDEQMVYGFGKTYIKDENGKEQESDVYRLILIADAYKNTIFINYTNLNSNEVASIIDSNNKEILFSYNNNKLASITDNHNNKINFIYKDSCLEINNKNLIVKYFYQNNKLAYVVDESTGLGVKFAYENNRVVKLHSISVLNNAKNEEISLKESYKQKPTATTLNSIELEQTLTINYYDYKSTILTDSKGNSKTYILNKFGETVCVYTNKFEEDKVLNTSFATQYNYQNNKVAETISVLPYSINYLHNVCFDAPSKKIEYGYYLGNTILSQQTIPFSYEVCKNYHTLPNAEGQKFCHVSVPSKEIETINAHNTEESKITNLVLSGWAKADSAFVFDVEDRYGNEFDQSVDKTRKFDIKAVVTYSNGTTKEFVKNFDWMNTGWQYCALPITLQCNQSIQSINCYVDYSNNTNEILFTDLELREGCFTKTEYNQNKQPVLSVSSHSSYITNYIYDEEINNRLVKEILTNTKTNEEYVTSYEYNKNGQLVRKTEQSGIVTENVYNDKGVLEKIKTYNKINPASAYFEEIELDEKGKRISELNQLGERVGEYNYANKTQQVSMYTDMFGNKTAYGYNNADALIAMSHSVNGEPNANLYGYAGGYLTSLSHNGFKVGYEYDFNGRIDKVDIAGQTYLNKIYNENSETTKLASGEEFRQVYDNKHNPTNLYYKSTQENEETLQATNLYDTVGNLTQTKEYDNGILSTTTTYTYNKFGHIEKAISNPHGKYLAITNNYTQDNNLKTTQLDLDDMSIKYTYNYSNNLENKLISINLPNNQTQTISYDALGRIDKLQLNQNIKQYNYLQVGNHATNLVASEWFGNAAALTENLKYKYNAFGNITEIKENGNLVSRFEYDSLNRLIREDNKNLGKTFSYAYDVGGNILYKKEYNFTLAGLENITCTNQNNYAYANSGWKDQLVNYNNQLFVYDCLGNPTTYKNQTLTWAFGRQLIKLNNHAFKYNANGIRIQKDNIKYYLNGNKIIAQQDENNTIYFFYGAEGVVGFEINGETYTYKKNILGDILGIYNSQNILICKYVYDAWGGFKCLILSKNGEYVTNSDNTMYNKISNINPFLYRGYYYDRETGLYYLNTRYYDPETGRFINADDISNLDTENINGLNLYMYCADNPVNNTDINGNKWWHWLVAAVVVIGAAVAVVATAGGAAAGIAAVSAVIAGGSAATVGASVAAGVFIGSVVGFGAMSIVAGIDAIGTWNQTGSFSAGVGSFSNYGKEALIMTTTGGLIGGLTAGISYAYYNTSGTRRIGNKDLGRPYSRYKLLDSNGKVRSFVYFDGFGHQYYRTDFDHMHNGYQPHVHTFTWYRHNNIWRYIESIWPF